MVGVNEQLQQQLKDKELELEAWPHPTGSARGRGGRGGDGGRARRAATESFLMPSLARFFALLFFVFFVVVSTMCKRELA